MQRPTYLTIRGNYTPSPPHVLFPKRPGVSCLKHEKANNDVDNHPHTKNEKKTDKQRTNNNEEKGCGEPNHNTKPELEFAKRINFIQFPNNLVLFTHV